MPQPAGAVAAKEPMRDVALVAGPEPSDADVVAVLQRLVDAAPGGKLLGRSVDPELAAVNPALTERIRAAGGLSAFCASCPELDFVMRSGHGSGWVERAASRERLAPIRMEPGPPGPQEVPPESTPEPNQEVPPEPKPKQKAPEAHGPRLAGSPARSRDVAREARRSLAGPVVCEGPAPEPREVVDALRKLVLVAGGKLLGSKVLPELAAVSPALAQHIEAAGGLKTFCEKCPELELVARGRGCGWLQWREKPRPPEAPRPRSAQERAPRGVPQRFREVCDRELAAALQRLVDDAGGKLLGSRVMEELGAHGPALLRRVEAAGGLAGFCDARQGLELVRPVGEQGCGWLQRRAPEPPVAEIA